MEPSGGIGQRPNFLVEIENLLNGIDLYVALKNDHAIHTETTQLSHFPYHCWSILDRYHDWLRLECENRKMAPTTSRFRPLAMIRIALVLLLTWSINIQAAERPCCMFNAAPEQMLMYVDIELAEDPNNQPNFLTFRVFPKDNFGQTTMDFLFSLPGGGWINHPVYKLQVGSKKLPADKYVQRDELDPFLFRVSLPEVTALEAVSFSIGWYAAVFPDYNVDFLFKARNLEIPYFGSWERKAMKGWRLAGDE